MNWLPDAFLDVHILDVIVAVLAVAFLWDRVLKRGWQAMRGIVHEADDRDILKEIADAVGPLNGRNLMQRLDDLEGIGIGREGRLAELERRQAQMENKLDVFIIAQLRGGRRFYDPCIHDDDLPPEVE